MIKYDKDYYNNYLLSYKLNKKVNKEIMDMLHKFDYFNSVYLAMKSSLSVIEEDDNSVEANALKKYLTGVISECEKYMIQIDDWFDKNNITKLNKFEDVINNETSHT